MSKICRILLNIFFIENVKKGLLLLTRFDKFDFYSTLLLKEGLIFDFQFWNDQKAKNNLWPFS
jgi:hypothetical protein